MKRLFVFVLSIFSLSLVLLIGTLLKFGNASPLPETLPVQPKTSETGQLIPETLSADNAVLFTLNDSYPLESLNNQSQLDGEPAYPIIYPSPSIASANNTPPAARFLLRNFLIIISLLIISMSVLAWLLFNTIKARREAQKSKDRFQALLTASPSAIMIFQNFKLIYVNPALEVLTGFTGKELLKMEIWQLIHPNSLRNLNNDEIFIQNQGFNFRSEFQIVTKSGLNKWVDFSTRSIDFDGKPAVLASSIDITDKKNYEKQLIDAEERYALIVLATNDGISDYDIKTGELYLSPQWKEMLGYADEELENTTNSWLSSVAYDDLDRIKEVFQKLKNGEISSFQTEYKIRCKDENIKWVAASFSVLFGPGSVPLRILGTHTDITERKATEEMLKNSELRYKSFFSKNSAVMIITDPETGDMQDVNQAAIDYYGYSREELSAMNISDVNILTPELIDDEIKKASQEERSYHYFQHKLADGSIRDVEVYSSIIQIQTKPLQYSIIFDITQRRKVEKELKKAKEIAEEASRVKSFFVSNVSHEIRTPLNAIIGLTDLILEEENLSPLQMENMKSIKYSSDHLLSVINDVLDFSKLEAGKVQLEQMDFDIYNLVKESCKTIEFKARENKIALNVNIQPEIPRVLSGDPSRLRQILLNLLSNAVKFTPQGHIDVNVEILSQDEQHTELKFSVSDTGIGIPEDRQSRVFESFTQANIDTSRKFGGTGLGLSICKKLVDLQNGTIGVKSVEGVGSTFWFELKYQISKKPFLPELGKAAERLKNLRGVTVLLVEDDKMNQFVMSQILKKWEAQLEIADNGKVAVAILEKRKFNVVLMDLHMPSLSGYEATRIIRDPSSKVLDHEVPVIALTADVTMETREKVKLAGMNDFITKPSDQEVMFDKIMRAVINKKKHFNEKKGNDENLFKDNAVEFEKSKIRIKKALADIFDDDLDSTINLINRFLREIPRTIIGINEAFYDKDFETLRKLVHRIKPGYSYMGFSELSEKINHIQELSKADKRLSELETLCRELDDASRDIIRILREIQREYIKGNAVDAPPDH